MCAGEGGQCANLSGLIRFSPYQSFLKFSHFRVFSSNFSAKTDEKKLDQSDPKSKIGSKLDHFLIWPLGLWEVDVDR